MDERKSFMHYAIIMGIMYKAKPENNKSLKDNRGIDNRHRRQCETEEKERERESLGS
jgi:hypothetical protein